MNDERYIRYKKILDNTEEYQIYVRNNKMKAAFMLLCTIMMWTLMFVMFILYQTPLLSLSFLGILLSGLTAISGLYMYSTFHDQPVFIACGTVSEIREYKKKKNQNADANHNSKKTSCHVFLIKDDLDKSSTWALDLKKINSGKEQIYKEGDHVVLFSVNENRSYITLSR